MESQGRSKSCIKMLLGGAYIKLLLWDQQLSNQIMQHDVKWYRTLIRKFERFLRVFDRIDFFSRFNHYRRSRNSYDLTLWRVEISKYFDRFFRSHFLAYFNFVPSISWHLIVYNFLQLFWTITLWKGKDGLT